jgi:hypothetical protein
LNQKIVEQKQKGDFEQIRKWILNQKIVEQKGEVILNKYREGV